MLSVRFGSQLAEQAIRLNRVERVVTCCGTPKDRRVN